MADNGSTGSQGTVVRRRWTGKKVAAIAADGFFELDVQREVDDGDKFSLVLTIEMPGETEVYNQVLNRVVITPQVPAVV